MKYTPLFILFAATIALGACKKGPVPAIGKTPPKGAAASTPPSSANALTSAQARLHIEGMVCQSCAEGAKSCLEGIGGVVAAEVSVEGRSAHVQYDAEKTSPEKMIAALEALDRGKAPVFHVTVTKPQEKMPQPANE